MELALGGLGQERLEGFNDFADRVRRVGLLRAQAVGELVVELKIDAGEIVAAAAVLLKVAQGLDGRAVRLQGGGRPAADRLLGKAFGEVGQRGGFGGRALPS